MAATNPAAPIARQLRVGVERDDVTHAAQQRHVADDRGEAVRGRPRSSAFRSASLPRLRS